MIITPNKSNCLTPAFNTPDAEDVMTANRVIQYKLYIRFDVSSNTIVSVFFYLPVVMLNA
ncbi:MAG: hypothetical protein Rpha_0238 [Candidatus Ruthia sp. Apha_13_S6]|nr:hypothetical protein [Candidatus Ruthia sp. Apha_13_S6]